jgi:hypothetical protein
MKALVALAFVTVLVGAAQAQQPATQQQAPPQAPAGQTCMSQHVEAPGVSAAALITRGYDIKAAVPGGLWVQKDREVYFCNSGRRSTTTCCAGACASRSRDKSANKFIAPQVQLIHKAGVG